MTSALSALQTAAIERLRAEPAASVLAALGVAMPDGITVLPGGDQAGPYIIVQQPSSVFADASTSAEGSDDGITCVAWASKQGLALRIAEAVQTALSDRTDPLTSAGFNFLTPTVEITGPPVQEPGTAAGEAPAWGCPVRVRYRIYRES